MNFKEMFDVIMSIITGTTVIVLSLAALIPVGMWAYLIGIMFGQLVLTLGIVKLNNIRKTVW